MDNCACPDWESNPKEWVSHLGKRFCVDLPRVMKDRSMSLSATLHSARFSLGLVSTEISKPAMLSECPLLNIYQHHSQVSMVIFRQTCAGI